ncbi:PilZ domain-containing protein [Desulfobacter hydrogenophilus]|uniref:PilZ domain-containing protein n=2 Tax=Desulfobacter hydrogenophilus TaxID=2291 RepID=A0A328FF53_9BACT|nr:PilZ domain-containing protein [Desulfobacter hydrogenophilus]QBH15374.1 PilZ domain-containing protein [Desulfobacter hydrogenophilus]RAM02450.1 PilZ domain-containing protein [Desulfobacter hydrogenophilus]
MNPSPEKRSARRYIHKLPMDLYRMNYQNKHNSYYAEMNDCSDNGLSLMTNEKLVLGELIYLELKNYDPNIRLPIKEQSYSGIIRWGKRYQSANAGTNGLYKYGIEFSTQNVRP